MGIHKILCSVKLQSGIQSTFTKPECVIHANTVTTFESRLANHWENQEILHNYNYKAKTARQDINRRKLVT